MTFNELKNLHGTRPIDQIDGNSRFTETARPADAMKVSFTIRPSILIHGQVKIDDHGDLFDVYTTGHDVGSDQDFLFAFPETIDDVDSLFNFQLAAE
jgi:hypothetical protein